MNGDPLDELDEQAADIARLTAEIASLTAEIERLRNGAPVNCETVQYGGVVPTVTWFDKKIAEECRIAQAEIERLRLTDAERQAIQTAMNAYGENNDDRECEMIEATLWGLLERTK
jgi:uncharacterized small protein (DUF1192 family)